MPKKPSISSREKAMGAIGAAALGYILVQHAAMRMVNHPDDESAHPTLQAHVSENTRNIADMNKGLEKVVDTLRELEKDRVAREKENELKRREFIRQTQTERDDKLIEALAQRLAPQKAPHR